MKTNPTTNKQIFNTKEGLISLFNEIDMIKAHIKESAIHFSAKNNYDVEARDNRYKICDLRFNGFTLLSQFYQASHYTTDSYLLYAIVKGYFGADSYVETFGQAELLTIIRLNFDLDSDNKFVWSDKESKRKLYSSTQITNIWINNYHEIATS